LMMSDAPRHALPKPCPVCGIAMLGKAKSSGKKIDYFECSNCNLVIDYSGPQGSSRDRQEN
jgi:hypothetical protein